MPIRGAILLLGALLLVGGTARAQTAPQAASDEAAADLLPLADLLRPEAPAQDPRTKVSGGCPAAPLPVADAALPFGPGERLSYDITMLGIRVGRASIRMAERGRMDQVDVFPLYAKAKTEGFLSVLGSLDGRMVSFLDAKTLTPVRMANRFFIASLGHSDVVAREDAAFTGPAVSARLSYDWSDGRKHTRPARLRSTSDLVDVLSVVYYMRTRALSEGERFCFEIYHRRRLWRVEGQVAGIELVNTPYGNRRARKLEATLRKVGGGDDETRKITAWVGTDKNRLPLAVDTPDRIGTLSVRLTGFAAGRPPACCGRGRR